MRSLSIRQALPILIVAPLVTTVGLTGWIAFEGGRDAVNDLVEQLADKVGHRLAHQIINYLDRPQTTNQALAVASRSQTANPDNFPALERYFWHLTQQFDQPFFSFYGNTQGNFIGVQRRRDGTTIVKIRDNTTAPQRKVYRLDAQGKRLNELESTAYDPRERPWYQAAVKAGKPSWSPVYTGTQQDLLVTAVVPIYQEKQQLKGVLAYDFSLAEISEYLRSLTISPASQVFIIERSGNLIASSTREPILDTSGPSQRRLFAQNSQNPIIRKTAQFLSSQFGEVSQTKSGTLAFDYQGQKQIVEIVPIQDEYGLDWLLIVVVPESDFMEQIHTRTRFSLLLGLTLTGLAAVVGVLVARWVTQPLQQLVTAAQDIQSQQFDPASLRSVLTRSDEIGKLAQVVEEMATVIFSREKSLQSQLQQIQTERNQARESMNASTSNEKLYVQQLLRKSRQIRNTAERQNLELPELLRTVPYFEQLNDSELQQLYAVGSQKTVQEGEYICRENEMGNAFYIILSGSVEVYIEHLQKYLRQLTEGNFFGELSLLLGTPRSATVKALEDSVLYVIEQNGFQIFLQQNPKIASEIAQKIEIYTAEMEQRKDLLKQARFLETEETFNQNPLDWIQKQMKTLFEV
ncbi:MAG: cyclic nucleotide-binding domain-containing protein [Leptolyngbyaceae cyanobacterium bins.59]|nr:cyclic nucleotide-binding domain-containing protein [Leptolyngbyaceae cyanobacterium bins.59]